MERSSMSNILIAGMGYVGNAVKQLFPQADEYDPKFGHDNNYARQFAAPPKNNYDFCMVCAPTPSYPNGACDTSMVEEVINKIKAEVFVIRSTVSLGTTNKLGKKYKANCVFQPEYCASSSPYPALMADLKNHSFIVFGGETENVKKVRRLYECIYPPTVKFIEMTALEAEICKLMENSFIGTYVTFNNEFYDICAKYGADWDHVREGFLADPRMTPWWTYITRERGFGGHCVPKDINNLIYETGSLFMKTVIEHNERHKRGNRE